ncbi:MAG: DMT family transporter [Myxococcota bacterium]
MNGEARSTTSASAALVGAALVIVSAVGFSGKAVLAKILYRDGVDPLSVIALRMGFALPIFAASAWREERRAVRAGESLNVRDAGAVLVLGGLGYYASVYGDFAGLQHISAGLERLLMFSYPTLVLLMSALAFKQRIHRVQIACLVLTYAGIALAFSAETNLGDGEQGDVWLGSGLVFASAFCYAAYLVGGSRYINRLGARRFTSLSLSAACVAALVHFAAAGGGLLDFSPRVYVLGVTMALLATVLPAFALSTGIRRIGPARAAVLGTVGPVSTLFLAYLLLGEPITVSQLLGAALVLVGATLVAFRGR